MTYIYRITNLINGKTYIGQRRCPAGISPLKDKYMGSGVVLAKAKKKYGIKNFKKDILICFFGDAKLYTDKAERYYIEEERKIYGIDNVYNIANGGQGDNGLKGSKWSPEVRSHHPPVSGKNNPMYNVHRYGKDNPFYGKHFSKESSEKLAATHRNRKWYNNGITQSYFYEGEQPEGWVRGMLKR